MKLKLDEMIAYSYCNSHIHCPDDCPYINNSRLCNIVQNVYIEDYFDSVYETLSMIQNTNEKSATKCWETINIIKDKTEEGVD